MVTVKKPIDEVLKNFDEVDHLAVKTQVEARLDSSQIKLLINLLEAATDKAFKEGKAAEIANPTDKTWENLKEYFKSEAK